MTAQEDGTTWGAGERNRDRQAGQGGRTMADRPGPASSSAPGAAALRLAAIAAAASAGGWLWNLTGLPLGWLMGAALVTGAWVMLAHHVVLPRLLIRAAHVAIGTGVGLAITPDVVLRMVGWLPLMILSALAGLLMAAAFAPVLARLGRVGPATAFFSLTPGGVIEMANIGGRAGADRMTIAALHTIRVGMVVGLLPLVLFAFYPHDTRGQAVSAIIAPGPLAVALAVGTLGGWIGHRVRLPAAWLLGAVLSVGVLAGAGLVVTPDEVLPPPLIAVAQIVVGMSLGARFERDRLAAIPRALAAGVPILAVIMGVMAALAVLASRFAALDPPALVLAFSIGGMAEMVLTAKALHQDVAIVAAFQAVRAVIVNLFAGTIWSRLHPLISDRPKGPRS